MANNNLKTIQHKFFSAFATWLVQEGESLFLGGDSTTQETPAFGTVAANPVSTTTGTANISSVAPSTATSVSPTH
jgi:hypothetical protein